MEYFLNNVFYKKIMMRIMKIINLLLTILFLFQSTPTFSMDEDEGSDEIGLTLLGKTKASNKVPTPLATKDEQKESTRLKMPGDQKDAGRSEDECCTHWGLKHWFYGIKEYIIDRCLCCGDCGFDPIDDDRAYIQEEPYRIVTSDCWCVAYVTKPYGADNCLTSAVCCPCATLTHLICFPVACCYLAKKDWWGTESGDHPAITKLREKQKADKEEKLKSYKHNPSGYSVPNYGGGNLSHGKSHKEYTTIYGRCPDTCTDANHKSIIRGESCMFYKKDETTPVGIPGVHSYMSVYSYPKKYCDYCGTMHKMGESWERTRTTY